MRTRATRKRRRKLGLLATAGAAFGAVLALGAGSAAAAVSCVYGSGAGLVTITVTDDNKVPATSNTIVVKKGGGEGILVNGAFCIDPTSNVSATTLNVDSIQVVPSNTIGADGNDVLVVDTRSGRFVPGFSEDLFQPSLNEIEWYVNLGLGSNQLSFFDTDAAGAVVVGDLGASSIWDGGANFGLGTDCFVPVGAVAAATFLNVNAFPADDDADIYIPQSAAFANANCATSGVDDVNLLMGGGDDFVSGKGSDGTGIATSTPLNISGGAGNDDLEGGLGSDLIAGGDGTDFIDGNAPSIPFVFGDQNDVLATWSLGGYEGDVVDFSDQAGPFTLTLNADGSVTGSPDVVVGIEHVIGSKGNDTITGNGLDNFLAGGAGDDTIDGGPGDDVVSGDDGAVWNTTDGTVSIETVGEGNDNLAGGLGDDVVIGGPGNDTLDENKPLNANGSPAYGPLGNGADALDGGPGIDAVDYSKRTNNTVVYLGLISTFNDGADTNGDGLTNEFDDVFFTTENVMTGSGNDIISANFVNNRVNNEFWDGDGNDCVEGGPGNDAFHQAASPNGADVLIGNTGSDTADYGERSGAVAVSLDGVANDGDIASNEGDNVGGFSVSCRPQTIVVNPPIGILQNLFGPDQILNDLNFLDAPVAGPAPNCFGFGILAARSAQGLGISFCTPGETLGGDQAPLANVDVENVNGGSGDDILVGDASGNVLNGNGGNDTISGGAGPDQLNGGAGDDRIAGGPGNDAIDGGEGTNWVDYGSAGAGGVGVQVNLTTGTATGDGTDTLKNIQNVNGSAFADSILGDAQNNILNGNGGNDAINGNAGNDTINGGAGADQLKGGAGDDKISGGDGNDAIQGGAGNDNLQGGNGKDTILGQQGNDKLYGNAQPDFLNGGPGTDTCKPGSPGLARGDVVVNCER